MQDADFSDEFCHFVQRSIPTLEAAEFLLALAAEPDRWWDQKQLSAKLRPALRISDVEAARYVDIFQKGRLLVAGADNRIQFRPASEDLAAQVTILAQANASRPVTLIRMIYAFRDEKLRSFADAFKLTRK